MKYIVKLGDILNEPADILVCSTNVSLNLSGGVGGAFREKYGNEMQEYLHSYLKNNNLRQIPVGTVIETPPFNSPYKAVLHAVAINAFYESTVEIITNITFKCFSVASHLGAHTIALPALATGYGNLNASIFAKGLLPSLNHKYAPLELVTVCTRNSESAATITSILNNDEK